MLTIALEYKLKSRIGSLAMSSVKINPLEIVHPLWTKSHLTLNLIHF